MDFCEEGGAGVSSSAREMSGDAMKAVAATVVLMTLLRKDLREDMQVEVVSSSVGDSPRCDVLAWRRSMGVGLVKAKHKSARTESSDKARRRVRFMLVVVSTERWYLCSVTQIEGGWQSVAVVGR